MKVLLIGGYPLTDKVSGSLAHAGNLARYLSAIEGMEVQVITLGDKDESFKSGDIAVHVFSRERLLNPCFLPFVLRSMRRTAETIDPDVIHAMRGFPYFLVAASLRQRYPVLLTAFSLSRQELRFERNPLWLLLRLFFLIPVERYVIPRIPHIIVQTRLMSRLVGRMSGAKIHIVPEGIEYGRMTQFQSLPPLNDPPDIFVAVSFRRLKGMDVLISAVPAVIRALPDLKVTIAGSGEEEANLKNLVRELGVANHVSFPGFITDEVEKNRYYKSCQIVVVPSRWDNEPYAPLDGAVFAKPAIVSGAANSSVVIDGETGFVFESENVAELVAKIIKLLTDDELRAQMGKAIAEKVKEYDWSKIAGRTAVIYREVITDFSVGKIRKK